MKSVKWKVLCGKTLIWLAAEIILCLVGMDDIADYSEFIFDRDANNVVCLSQNQVLSYV